MCPLNILLVLMKVFIEHQSYDILHNRSIVKEIWEAFTGVIQTVVTERITIFTKRVNILGHILNTQTNMSHIS